MKKRLILVLAFLTLICLIHPGTAAQPAINHSQNYTAILTYGQTPYQIGYLSKSNVTGWTWWDSGDLMQNRKQQNIIFVNILLNGTPTPVTGLSPPSFERTDEKYRTGTGTYSYKADHGGAGDYSNNTDIWHFLDDHSTYDPPWEDIDLTNYTSAELNFYTYYEIEEDRDFGYVKISTDRGRTWTELANYTGSSGGDWIEETIDLTSYAGEEVIIAFNFRSDHKNVDQGWYIDDISVTTSGTSPTSLLSRIWYWVKSTLGILSTEVFSDGAEDPVPNLSVIVDYPAYNHTTNTFSNRQRTVELVEDYQSQGLYYGAFLFENESDTYTGEYTVSFNQPMPDSTPISVQTSFNTTLWGCQARGCHDTYSMINNPSVEYSNTSIHPNALVTPSVGSDCQSFCHSPYSSQFLTATPAHLHEIIYGHEGGFILGEKGNITIFNVTSPNPIIVTMYSESEIIRPRDQTAFNVSSHAEIVDCTECHTFFVHDNNGTDEHLIASPENLTGTNISSAGVHAINVTCQECHRTLSYPSIPNQYSLDGTIGSYDPAFTSYLANTKTYIIDVQNDINITVDIEDSTYGVTLTLIGPMDNTSGLQNLNGDDSWEGTYFVPSIDGKITFKTESEIFYPLGGLKVSNFTAIPSQGTWIARLFSWSPGSTNYTITSSNNNPIAEKPVIHIPWNCSECHNPLAVGKAHAERPIPQWDNNGLSFAHTDFDDDSKGDVPCRSCHNAFHEIAILDCQECHNTPPSGHIDIVEGKDYFSAVYNDCFLCHGDPHDISPGGGPNCTHCHLEGGGYTDWSGPILNRTGFFDSVHHNITGDFNASNYSEISRVCWGCHVDYEDSGHTRPASELPECKDCHATSTPLNADHLRKQPPIQIPEHQPDGGVIQTNATCFLCHNNSLSIPIPTTNVKYAEPKNYVSHYVSTNYLMTPTNDTLDCFWCHVTETDNSSWGYPVNPMTSTKLNHTPIGITDNTGCYPCHISSRVLVDGEIPTNFTFHADGMAGGAGRDCAGCHAVGGLVSENYQIDAEAMNVSGAVHHDLNRGAEVTEDPNSVRCWGCHGDGDGSEAAQPTDGHPDNFRNPLNCSERDCHNVNQSIFNEPIVYEHFRYVDEIDENLTTAADCPVCHLNSVVSHGDTVVPSDTSLVSHYGSTNDLIDTASCIYCHLDEDNAEKWGDAPDPTDNISIASDKKDEYWENTMFVGDTWHLGNRYILVFDDIAGDGNSAHLRLYQGDTLLEEIVVSKDESYIYEADLIDRDGNVVTETVLELNFTAVFRGEKIGLVKVTASPWKRIHPEDKDPTCWACHMDNHVIDREKYLILDEDEDRIYYVEKLLDFSDEDTRDKETLIPGSLVLKEGYSRDLQVDEAFVLTAKKVDTKGRKAHITLTKDGTLLEEDVYREGEYLEYEEDLSWDGHTIEDVVIFTAKVDSIFRGADCDVVMLTDVRVFSDRLMAIDNNETLGGYNTSWLHINDLFFIGGPPDTFHVPPLNEGLDGSSDCVYCHDTGNGFGISSVDAIASRLGGHSGLNANASSVKPIDDINKACWACHGIGVDPGRHPADYLYPRQCEECHVELEEPTFGAVDLSDEAHGQVEDCNRCHAADYPGLHVINVFEPLTPYIVQIHVTPEVVRPGEPVKVDVTAMSGWNMKVEAIEYFIDVEGPPGTGTPVMPEDGIFDEQLEDAEFTVNTTGLEPGNHTVYVHSMERGDKWGPVNKAVFTIETPELPVEPEPVRWWIAPLFIITLAALILLLKSGIFKRLIDKSKM